MSTSYYGTLYSTNPQSHSKYELPYGHPSTTYSSEKRCPVPFARKPLDLPSESGNHHEYIAPQESDVRSVCPALNALANHGYIPRDGRNLTFLILFRGLRECYNLSIPLAIVLVLGGFILIHRFPIRLPFNVPPLLKIRNPDGSRSQPGEIDLHLVGRHGCVEHNASLVHEDCPSGSKYASNRIRHDWLENMVGDVLPGVRGYTGSSDVGSASTACLCSSDSLDNVKEEGGDTYGMSSSSSIISRLEDKAHRREDKGHRRESTDSSDSSETVVADDDEPWRQYATDEYRDTLVSAADVGRMRARREREIAPKQLDSKHAEIARGEMAIILGVWERSEKTKDGSVKKGIPLPDLLIWLAEGRLPPGWKPGHVQGLWDVVQRSKAIKATADAVVKAKSF